MKIIRHTVGGPRYAKKEIAEGPVYSCGLSFPGVPVGKPVDVHVSLQCERPDQKMGSHQYEVCFTSEEEARMALSILTEFLQRRGVDLTKPSATFLLQAPMKTLDAPGHRIVKALEVPDRHMVKPTETGWRWAPADPPTVQCVLSMIERLDLTMEDMDVIESTMKAKLP